MGGCFVLSVWVLFAGFWFKYVALVCLVGGGLAVWLVDGVCCCLGLYRLGVWVDC